MRSSRFRSDRQRGSALMASFFLAVAIGALSYAMLQEGVASRGHLVRVEDDVRALEIAESGLARAEREIQELIDTGDDGVGFASGTYAGGSYDVTAARDPVWERRWTLVSTGRFGRSTRRVEVYARRVPNSLFLDALLSHDDLVFNGLNTTDQYDSSLGTYESQAVNEDAGGVYAEIGGSVGSNAGFIELKGTSTYVRADAVPGPGHSVYERGNPTVIGDTTARQFERVLEPAPYEDFLDAYLLGDNVTGWTVSGGNTTYDPVRRSLSMKAGGRLTLTGGTYFFSSLSLSGNSVLEVTGPSKIYVTGNLDTAGGQIVNTSTQPGDLLVFAHPYDLPEGYAPTTTTVKLTGGSKVAMGLYAPGADLTIAGGDDLYGSAVAKTISVGGNVAFHYDKALDDLVGYGTSTVQRIAWRELTAPKR